MTSSGLRPRVSAVLEHIDGGRVLDVGATGQGLTADDPNWLHGRLDQLADDLVGVDIDDESVRNHQSDGWDIRVDDAQTLETISTPVDYIVAAEVIEHLGAPGDFLASSKELLEPGGEILLTTPNPWSVTYLRRVVTGGEPVGNDEHTCWFDETTLRQLAERYGFDAEITHLPPAESGLSSLAYRARPKLGGTRLFAILRVDS